MTRVALFGGSFNPPHVAHQLVALYVLETQPVDELWFVPTYSHPFGKALAAFEDRVAMCQLVAGALGPRARVSRAEETLAKRPDFVSSRTLDLIDHVIAEGHAPRLVIGGDILGETAKWYRWEEVVARAPLVVIGLSGHPLPEGSVETGVVMPAISSTRVRELLATHRDDLLAPLLPATVLRYIASRGLYDGS
ncbi:MAG: nicotinate-nicotinamide nucleotide adenylyltransferase [Proteobacteria bacterium]|nr:nicotinate-nicotinamide nucleotide adenylyltransferase [Pseudomonadota bacterium]